MPSREEIIELLIDASRYFDNEAMFVSAKRYKNAADQVSAMRCETCRYWHKAEGLRSDYCSGMKWNEVDKMGPDFGCFRHEQKKPAG